MKFESINMTITNNKNTRNLNDVKAHINLGLDMFNYTYESCKNCNNAVINKINLLKNDLSKVEKAIRKANAYKHIELAVDRDYNKEVITITFPKNTKKSFIKEWLVNNDYPTKDIHHNVSCEYDCTGECCMEIVEIRNGVVTIFREFDM